MQEKKKEKEAICFSLIAGIVLLIIEIIMSVITDSKAMLTDALYDSIDIIIVILTLFLIKLYNTPISEKKPFGFSQLESFFLLIKTFMILALNISIIINAIISILSGGKEIDIIAVSLFQFMLFIGNLIIWLIIRNFNKKVNSPTIKTEVIAWKFDMVYSFGMAFAFFVIQFLENTIFKNIIPYFDQVVVIISSIVMLPELFKVLKENITSVLLFAPNKVLTDGIKKIIEKHLLNYNMEILHYDIIKTGRKTWISIYFKVPNNIVDIMQLKEITIKCSKELNEKIGNIYFELVPDVEIIIVRSSLYESI